ncbi:MAG: sigma-E factor negative regulatory protein [Thermomonas sp.]
MNNDIAKDATDLTQLSSREQLSALMDGALSADETRFLLRRLQHDASLAKCWERWRLCAEVMRGLAPAQRLPADFASRVAASVRGEEADGQSTTRARTPAMRTPTWLRWGGGAAVAASLAVAAVMTRPAMMPTPDAAAVAVANAELPASAKVPPPPLPAQDPGAGGFESQTAALATVLAVAARPTLTTRRSDKQSRATGKASSSQPAVMRTQERDAVLAANDSIPSLLPPVDIAARPWPRSVLSQYAGTGITVGFGDSARGTVLYNPFQARTNIGGLPPAMIVQPSGADANAAEAGETGNTAGSESPRPPQP